MVEKIGIVTFFISILLIGTFFGTVVYGNYGNPTMVIMVDQEQLHNDTPELLQTKVGYPFPWDVQRFVPSASNLAAVNLSLTWRLGAEITVDIWEWDYVSSSALMIYSINYSLEGEALGVPEWVQIDFPEPIPVDGSVNNYYIAVYTNTNGNAAWWGYEPDVGQGYDYTWRNNDNPDAVDAWDYGFRTYFEASSPEPSPVSPQQVPVITPLGGMILVGLLCLISIIEIRKKSK